MVADKGGQAIANHHNFLSVMRHEDADETVDEAFTMHLHQGLRCRYSLLGKARALAGGYDCVFHECLKIKGNDILLKHLINAKLVNVIANRGAGVEFFGNIKLGFGVIP